MATLNRTTADSILKDLYPADVLKDLTEQVSPFMAMVPKAQWAGRKVMHPIIYGGAVGVSNTFANASTNKSSAAFESFEVTLRKLYTLSDIDNALIETAKTDKGAFANALELHADVAINSAAKVLATELFRSGGGAIGQVASVTSTLITLTNKDDVVNFEVGRVLQGDTLDGGGTVHSGTEPITAVDRDAGTLTAAAWTDISGIAANDYLFLDGGYDTAIHGLAAWLPMTAPGGSDSFMSVNRSTDSRLGGCRVTSAEVSGLDIVEKAFHAMSRLRRDNGKPDVVIVSPDGFRKFSTVLKNHVQYASLKPSSVAAGFSSIEVAGPAGSCEVLADPFCPSNRMYVLQKDTWKLYGTNGGNVGILDQDGQLIRLSSDDAYELRVGFYGNLACSAPGWNCVVDLA